MALRADTVLKLSLAAGALLAGAGVGYYYGIFLPAEAIRQTVSAGEQRQSDSLDRQAAFERARAAEARRREAAQAQYQSCLDTADLTYRERWASGCRAQHARQQAAFDDCADDWFRTREGCAREFPVQPEHGCALPEPIASRLTATREAARSQCLGELQGGAPLGAGEQPGGEQGGSQEDGVPDVG